MATQQYLFVLFILLVSAASTNGVRWGALLNSWPPIIDSDAPKIQNLAKFAVSEYNEESGSSLKYYKVLGGGSQPLSNKGRRYKLEIKTIHYTSDQTLYDTFEAVVSVVCEDDDEYKNNCSREVISFDNVQ
ncbi:hypothetical protein ZOSMA_55G00550 [Zostera marina]|uniref:Cystatin domain-containing protein n=1 Tax=Zostera marina TaxID=29655 RepID=A0A0K9NWG6_ZOSMR|nr:hypothetical protein ZOSMA_55G00550 [Zostera marina]